MMKCFEKCIDSMLKAEVAINLDNLQFANRQAKGTKDAIKQHLEAHKAYALYILSIFAVLLTLSKCPC